MTRRRSIICSIVAIVAVNMAFARIASADGGLVDGDALGQLAQGASTGTTAAPLLGEATDPSPEVTQPATQDAPTAVATLTATIAADTDTDSGAAAGTAQTGLMATAQPVTQAAGPLTAPPLEPIVEAATPVANAV